jgi:hypothetical protein
VTEAEIERLPDPYAFRDALFLREYGAMSQPEMDASDALVVAIMWRLRRRPTNG